MRIVVTGKNGQLARALLARSAGADGNPTVLALGRPEIDLAAPRGLLDALAAAKPDVVVNAAAYTAVDRAEAEPEVAYAINRDGAAAVAAAAAAIGAAVIQISTDYVFDGAKGGPYSEDDPTAPLNVYGRSKREGEVAVAAANPRHVIVRTSWVFSAEGHNFVRTMLRLADERPRLTVVDDQRGAPTYAPHLADALLAIAVQIQRAEPDDARFGAVHVTGAGETTWAGFAEAIFSKRRNQAGPLPEVVAIASSDYPTPARRPLNSRLDGSRLRDVFGIVMPPWEAGLAECLAALGAAGEP